MYSNSKKPRAKPLYCCGLINLLKLLLQLLIIVVVVSQSYLFFSADSPNLDAGFVPTALQQFKGITYSATRNVTLQQQPKATVAFAISITACDESRKSKTRTLIDGAITLKHSIYLNSIHNAPNSDSKYSYQMYAFIHTSAVSCSLPYWPLLQRANYTILTRDTPFNISDLKSDWLRERMNNSGCCGEKEFLKLYAYTLTDHPIAVHLDVDTMILQPLDELFDCMLGDSSSTGKITSTGAGVMLRSKLKIMNGTWLPPPTQPIQAYFTRDYGMVGPGKQLPGVQGGFIVVRTNQTVFEEQVQAIIAAEFKHFRWAKRYGGYYGAPQIQGFLSYYYDGLHPNTTVELDYCLYNNMYNYPYDFNKSTCLGPPLICQDCIKTELSIVKTAHFTDKCHKPWTCSRHDEENDLCHKLTKEWFRIRRDYELRIPTDTQHNIIDQKVTMPSSLSSTVCKGTYNDVESLGCCKGPGLFCYLPITQKEPL